jgi:hypothetical protein
MSWDAWIYKLDTLPSPSDQEWERLPERMRPLGSREEVEGAIAALPYASGWENEATAWLNGDGYTLWLTLWPVEAAPEQVERISTSVYGDGDPLAPLAALCRPRAWSVLDLTTGGWLDWNQPRSGFERWRAVRDRYTQALGEGGQQG